MNILSRRDWLGASLSAGLANAEPVSLKRVPLGDSGLTVSELAYGCEDTPNVDLLKEAFEAGINHFHCFHGAETMGKLPLLKQAFRSVRDKVVIAGGSGERTPEGLLEALDTDLCALGSDYFDIWYMSSRNMPEYLSDECLSVMECAIAEGKIRALGITTHSLPRMEVRINEVRSAVKVVMVTCNFATWAGGTETPRPKDLAVPPASFHRECVTRLHEAGFGIVGMKPMLGGLAFVPKEFESWAASLSNPVVRGEALASALRWVLQNPNIDTALVTTRNSAELRANIEAAKRLFDGTDEERLSKTLAEISPFYCRMCDACTGSCRQSLPVADVLRYLLYHDGYGQPARATDAYRTMPPVLRNVRCIDCEACSVRCPHGVIVRDQMARAQSLLA